MAKDDKMTDKPDAANPVQDQSAEVAQDPAEKYKSDVQPGDVDFERVEGDVNNPGDEVTTAEEDDDPENLAGDEVDDSQDNS